MAVSVRYDLLEGRSLSPYLIAGAGTGSLETFEWEYLAGAGVEWKFRDGLRAFTEVLHTGGEGGVSSEADEVRAGLGVEFSGFDSLFGALPFFRVPFLGGGGN